MAEKITFEAGQRNDQTADWRFEKSGFSRSSRQPFSPDQSSPYFRLLKSAGCEPEDVRRLVRRRRNRECSGKVTASRVSSFPGKNSKAGSPYTPRQPDLRRCGTKDFDNPVVREHFSATSGGTSGRPVRVRIDIEELAEAAVNWAVCFDAHGWKDRPLLFWTAGQQ